MAINGIELEVGQEWLTRGGQRVRVTEHMDDSTDWPFLVERNRVDSYTVTPEGYALASDCPRDTDLVQPLRRDSDHAAPLPVAEPQDSNTVTSAQVNDWIEWHGGECPVGPSTPIEVRLRNGILHTTTQPGDFVWKHFASYDAYDIVAYRVVKPALFHERERVDGEHQRELEIARSVFVSNSVYGKFFGVKPVEGVGDINSTAKGSGARYNTGKAPLELIPLSIIVPFYNSDNAVEGSQDRALRALDALGMFQAREGSVYEVLRELGDHWNDCAQVFNYGRRKYAAWNWAKGMAWSIPIACAARHLMAIIRGEETDPESGLPHVGHVYCNVVMLLTYASTFTEGDDRPAKGMLL